jgi:LysR family transcriptional regulator, glycine cleavage system transcriptional activator
MKLSHLNALRALEASVRLGSFRAAGTELNVSPAAVGQQVKKLEEAVGLVLLERTPNGFAPTALANQVADQLTIGFRNVADAFEILTQGNEPDRLSVSVVPSIAEYWLAPLLPEFGQANPGIDLRLDSTSTILNPAESHFNFALRYGPESPGQGEAMDLFTDYLLPVCTPDLAARIAPENRSAPFGDVALLHTDPSTGDPRWLDWPGWCTALGYHDADFGAGAKFTYTTLAIRAMFAGHGMHLCQLSVALPALLQGRLSAPFGKSHCIRVGYPYRLVSFNPTRQLTVHKRFREWIVEQAAQTEREIQDFVGGIKSE